MRRGARGICVLVLAAAALAPACDKSDSIVVVKVAADPEVVDVVQLRALVSNAGDGTTRLFPATPAAEPIAFETSFSLSVPRDRTGALDIALDGLGDGGAVIATGAGTIDLRAGDSVTVTITLHAGPSLCGNGLIDDGEGCDDGDRFSNGTCDYFCQPRTAGPGGGGQSGTGGTAGVGGSGGTFAGTGGRGGAGGATGMAGQGGTAGRPCTIELLTSGGFDGNNSRWTQVTTGRMLIYDQSQSPPLPSFVPAAQTPTRLAWLGYDAHSMEPTVRQNIQVPADALKLNISGWYQIQTEESGCQCDHAYVEIERIGSDAGVITTTLKEWSAENANTGWAYFATFVDATAIAGQTVAFQVHVVMDDGVNTSFYFDSLSVTADICP